MAQETHISVTVDFSYCSKGRYDVRIPVHQPIKQLIGNLIDALKLDLPKEELFAAKVPLKNILLTDEDRLADYPVANGDVIAVLKAEINRISVS